MNKLDEAEKYIKTNKERLNKQYRLEYHLMGEYGWINDPNGFIQYKGKYHLFYQHHPFDAVWGPMHWGHAISEDLIKWHYAPLALAPDEEYDKDGCFSGSAIEKDEKLCLIYTGNINTNTGVDGVEYKQVQNLAYSEDGVSFKKYSKNPVIGQEQIPEGASKKDFRDPKVFKKGQYYYVVLGSNDGMGDGQVLLYRSLDLKRWEFVNILAKGDETMGFNWECPDLFELDGLGVLIISAQHMKARGNDFNNPHSVIYFIGDLDIEKGVFQPGDCHAVDYGFDFYAPQTTLDKHGRRLMVAWMDMWEMPMPTQERGHNWAGAMTLPREIVMVGDRLHFKPIEEIKNYRKNHYHLSNFKINGEKCLDTIGECYELEIEFDAGEATEFGVKVREGKGEETILCYDREESLFIFNRDKSGIGPKGERKTEIGLKNNKLKLRIFVDRCSVEVFINDGEKTMTGRIYPGKDSLNISVFSRGECTITTLDKWDIIVAS